MNEWWFAPQPRGRVAVLRAVLYTFVILDILVVTTSPVELAEAAAGLYQPLLPARVLHLPAPTPVSIGVLRFLIVGVTVVALCGLRPRASGAGVFVLYLAWMIAAFSYGKVDHDRFAMLVALAVLPTVGDAHRRDATADEAAGWALRCIQVAVVLTYFLAGWAKLRFGGLEWVNGASLLRAVARRGTFIASPLMDGPWILQGAQYAILSFELLSPLAFVSRAARRAFLWSAVIFHAATYATITISFLPHVLCLLAWAPLERLWSSETGAAAPRFHLRIR